MLVITIKQNKSFTLTVDKATLLSPNDEIKIILMSTKHGVSRIGIVAPKTIKVLRSGLEKIAPAEDPQLTCVSAT